MGLVPGVKNLKIGPFDGCNQYYGPLVTKAHLDKVKGHM